MVKIVLDTGVLISNIGGFRSDDIVRDNTAKAILDFLKTNSAKFALYFSERTKFELLGYFEKNGEIEIAMDELMHYSMLPSHSINETWDEINLTWGNLESKWGDNDEFNLGESLATALPDKSKKRNNNDRGIVGDAIMNSCHVILHENPRDFIKLEKICSVKGILIVNLLNSEPESIIFNL